MLFRSADLLRRRGRRYGFGVSVVRYAKVYGDIVSSSRVRSLILRGRVCETSRMLGRLYHIEGTVIKGAGRGASLMNIPTANIAATNELIPKEGVYAVRVSFDDNVHNGVANIGSNPTFDGNKMSYEVHIFDFNRNILGEKLRIHFIDRIRDEKKFLGFKELEEQIKKDIEKARFIISKRDDPLYL